MKCRMLDKGTWLSRITSICIICVLTSGSLHYSSVVYSDYEKLDVLEIMENIHWGILFFTTAQMSQQMFKGSGTMIWLDKQISHGIFQYSPYRSACHTQILDRAQSKHTFLARIFEIMTFGGASLQFVRAAFFNPKRSGWDLFYRGWLPFEVNSPLTYIIGNCFQLLVAVFICLTIIGFVNSFMGVSEHLVAQFYILKDVLRNTKTLAKTPEDVPNIIRLCVLHQQTIYTFFEKFQSYLSYMLLWMFINFAFILCTIGFLLTDKKSTPEVMLSFIMILIPELIIPFTFCWYSQMIFDESSGIREAVNDMEWYTLPPQYRKSLVLILTRSQKPLALTGGRLKKYSLESYQEILTTAYNLLTMLRVVRN